MRLVRTVAGGFLNVDKIERLVDERGQAANGCIAVCADGEKIPLAPSRPPLLGAIEIA